MEKESLPTVAHCSLQLTDCMNLSASVFLRDPYKPGHPLVDFKSTDGFLAQSGDSHIDSVPLFNPLSSLCQDSQEACGYLISHFIHRLENIHQTLQLYRGDVGITQHTAT